MAETTTLYECIITGEKNGNTVPSSCYINADSTRRKNSAVVVIVAHCCHHCILVLGCKVTGTGAGHIFLGNNGMSKCSSAGTLGARNDGAVLAS